ncbi:MAG: leucine-rich repeat domain-containing protein, partial [Clostridia bacterium]|nr:leucine-rich repeat domain-containing protein [Clostridia bacterium]
MTAMKRAMAILLSAVLLFAAALPAGSISAHADAEDPASGACGENLAWRYDADTRTLTISGTGEMDSYLGNPPWSAFASTMQTAVIESGVTSIGNRAFYACSGLTAITIADSVTSIGNHAFNGCTGLTRFTVPAGVTVINSGTFRSCSGLTEITIPDGVTSLGNQAFNGCAGLTEITIPGSVTSIGGSTFYGCTGLTSVEIPAGVASIEMDAFGGCTGLTSLTVSAENSVYHSDGNCIIKTESKELIAGCKTSVIPADGSVTSIFMYAFYGCAGLTELIIPDGVTEIGFSAFYDCTGLQKVTIGRGLTNISGAAFLNCAAMTSITLPDSVETIGDNAFLNCAALADVYYAGGESDRQGITVRDYNDSLNNATWHYNSNGPVDPDHPPVAIQGFVASRDVDYKASVTFTMDLSNAPAGTTARWFVDGEDA